MRFRPVEIALPAVALGLFLTVIPGCGGQRPPRVMVLGLDGADPDVIDLLVSEGKLPNFARLRRDGASGRLESRQPLLSPVIWTTIATGKTPDLHRIGHFAALNSVTGEQLPVTSRMRKVKALWNIVSDSGRSSAVVGWWATWPAEQVRGSIVSDHLCYHFLFEERFQGKPASEEGVTWPRHLLVDVKPLVKRPGDVSYEEASAFVTVSRERFDREFSFRDDLSHFKWALATAESYSKIGLRQWEKERPDLLMVYVEGVDTTSHLFGHLFRAAHLSGELAEQASRYGHAVESMYEYADRLVGAFLDAMDAETSLLVVSDHGFSLGELPEDPSMTRDLRRVSEQYHDPEGIVYLCGDRVKTGSRFDRPTILDIAPTILALLGLPPAEDMPGRVLEEGLQRVKAPPRVASYETAGAGAEPGAAGGSETDAAMLEKLQSLGYLGTESPAGDRMLAAVLFDSGRYAEAERAYRSLLAGAPDDPALHASLAGVLGALQRYDEALEHLDVALKRDPLNVEAYHNRAVINERRGRPAAALDDYQSALRYDPDYEPSRRALLRLQGSEQISPPRSRRQAAAQAMARQASVAARQGNYDQARRLLDEAVRTAPEYALLYQYRSNVAYLMGDRAAAIESLRKGLSLDPRNALFRENLRRLEAGQPDRSP